MFEKLLKSAFDSGGDVFVYMNGFNNPLRGRVQDMDDAFFTLFQNGKFGTILWAFRLSDVLSCGLVVGPPVNEEEVYVDESEENVPYTEPDN
ncbi:MAG TPA: hypothetical protein V6C52_06930 [Coleofasciculaceae cyanobacterium]|jgi:hypothetical protein